MRLTTVELVRRTVLPCVITAKEPESINSLLSKRELSMMTEAFGEEGGTG